MKEEQRYEHRPQDLKKKEDFVVTVLRRTGERFFDQKNIQDLKAKQREIFKGVPYASQTALDNMLDKVMKKLREKHDEQIRQFIRNNQLASKNYRDSIDYSGLQTNPKQPHIQPENNINARNAQPQVKRKSEAYLNVQGQHIQKVQSSPQYYKIMKDRQKALRKCFFKIEYTYNKIDQTFKQKYKHHIGKVINHIHNNISHMTFISDYKVVKMPKSPNFKLKVKVKMGDSDFIYKQKNNNAFLKELSTQQVIYWMWSFAHMINEMEKIGVYHQDLQPRNTIKLGSIFSCIDFQYSFLIDDKRTKQDIKEMLKSFRNSQTQVFARMALQPLNFSVKKQNYKRKDETILKKFQQLLQSFIIIQGNIQKSLLTQNTLNNLDYLDNAYEQFKKYLKVFHKISFLRCLLDVSSITSEMGTLLIKDMDNKQIDKEQEILEIIKTLDFKGQSNVYHQFIQAIKAKNPYLTQQQSIPLLYTIQVNESLKVSNVIKEIAKEKHKNLFDLCRINYQFIAPIIQDSIKKEGTSCRIRNSCTIFMSPLDFWKLKKPRYLHYLFVSAKSMLDLLECQNIYLTHLSIKDFVKEGQFFLLRTLENALMLTTSQQKHDAEKLSREFIKQLFKIDCQSAQEVDSLKAICQTKWFTDIIQSKKESIDEKDYQNLIAFLKANKENLLHKLMKQLFDNIEVAIIQLEQEEYKYQVHKIKKMIDEAKKPEDLQDIFAQFKQIQNDYPGTSFASTVNQCSEPLSSDENS